MFVFTHVHDLELPVLVCTRLNISIFLSHWTAMYRVMFFRCHFFIRSTCTVFVFTHLVSIVAPRYWPHGKQKHTAWNTTWIDQNEYLNVTAVVLNAGLIIWFSLVRAKQESENLDECTMILLRSIFENKSQSSSHKCLPGCALTQWCLSLT